MEVPMAATHNELQDAFWRRIIYTLSVVICAAVAFLILGPRPETGALTRGSLDVSALPHVNATFNGITTALLLGGLWAIQQRQRALHQRLMLTAFGSSSAFLVSYVMYHWFKDGPRHYTGDFTILYGTILISHILLAAIILPMALFTLYRAFTGNFAAHKKIARWTFPVWLYVSVTGVQIYVMLYQ